MQTAPIADKSDVLGRSLFAAGSELGLNRTDVGKIIGRDRTSIERNGVDPDTKAGELALLLIRIYRSLYALMGGDRENMLHFMRTVNRGTGGLPAEQLHDVPGLVAVCEYLDAMRGKG
jgi:hypothetical protein